MYMCASWSATASVPMRQLSFELESESHDNEAVKKKQRILDRAIEDAFCKNDTQSFRVGHTASKQEPIHPSNARCIKSASDPLVWCSFSRL